MRIVERDFDYHPVPPKLAKKIKTSVRRKNRLNPVDTAEYTQQIVQAFKSAPKLSHSIAAVRWLDQISDTLDEISQLINNGNSPAVKGEIKTLNNLLLRGPGKNIPGKNMRLRPSSLVVSRYGNQRYASSIKKLAQTYFDEATSWQDKCNNKIYLSFDMASYAIDDASNLLHLSNYILVGNRPKARHELRLMDTEPRDKIPQRIHDWIDYE